MSYIDDLADAFLSLAEHFNEMNANLGFEGAAAAQYGGLSLKMSEQATVLQTSSVNDDISNSAQAMQDLTESTASLKSAINVLNDINQAIKLAGAAITLASAAMTGNPEGVGSAAADIRSAVEGLV